MRAAPLRAVADGALLARFFGDRQPDILALHGWGRDGSDFAAVLDGLPAIAPDLPGFGFSPPPKGTWGAEDYARRLAPVMSELRTPALVVGHSFGGRVAVCLAAQRPDLVRGLLLTGAPLVRTNPPASPHLAYRLARWGHRRGLVSDSLLEALRQRYGSRDYQAARGVMREVLVKVVNESYEQQLEALSPPVDLIWGAQDREVPVDQARVALQLMKAGGCRVNLSVIPGAGHDLPISHPDSLRDPILRMQDATGR